MSYCRFCGTEIAYKRTKNYKWMPCNLLTGELHFCQEGKDKSSSSSGLIPCPICGKATFSGKEGIMDYDTLTVHKCKNGDITRYNNFLERRKKLAAARKEKVIKQDKVQKKRKTVKTGQTKTSGKKKTSVKSKSDTEFFLNLSPEEIKHTVVEMPVGIGMSSYLQKLWKEGKL